jgi:hypothetical protein
MDSTKYTVNHEEYGLLGCNTVQFVDVPAFWKNIMPISSGSKIKNRKTPAEANSACHLLSWFLAWVIFQSRTWW